MKTSPCGYFVYLKMAKVVEKTTASGILLTHNMVQKENKASDTGVVIAVGPTAYTGFAGIDDKASLVERCAQWGFKIGDTVKCTRYDGKLNEDDEDMYRIVRDDDILEKVEEVCKN